MMLSYCESKCGYRKWAILFAASIVVGQPPTVLMLTGPEAVLKQPMLQILPGIRELSDGGLLLLDSKDRRAYYVDRELSSARQIGAIGAGPGEYQRPTGIFALPGDTSVIRDGGSGARLLVVKPNGTTGPTLPPSGLADARDPRVFPGMIRATDERGNYYAIVRPSVVVPGNPDSGDTLAIVRWSRRNPSLKIMAFLPAEPRPGGGGVVNGMGMYPDPSNIPFRSLPQWAVSPDGRVAVAHHTPYRVELFDSAGKRIADVRPTNAPIRVTAGHRREWLADYALYEEEERRKYGPGSTRPPAPFPEFLPAFLRDALQFDPSGRLWIHRTSAAVSRPTFDVIDTQGRVSFRVTHLTASRLVGFGKNGAVYFARPTADGFEVLERYRTR